MTLSVLPRRRWNQFRVRTLLILAALATIPFAWVGMKLRQAQRYQQAVTWLESTNGYGPDTDIDDNISWWEKWDDSLFGIKTSDIGLHDLEVSDLSPLAGLKNVRNLFITNSPVRDLSPVAALTRLELLYLQDVPVSDLSPLAGSERLKHLSLHGTAVSDLSPVSELDDLRSLAIDGAPLRDLAPLATLRKLEYLDLFDVEVTDLSPLLRITSLRQLRLTGIPVDNLRPLGEMDNLEAIHVSDVPVGERQIEWLRQRLPNCQIRHRPLEDRSE